MRLDIYDQTGKKTGKKAELADEVFGTSVNKSLLSQYVFTYLSNQREAIAHAKDRGAVSGGGKKPWKQKGTGRARAGSNRSPLWKGGGVTFGPSSMRNWKKQLNKKMKKGAICSAFSALVKADKLKLLQDIKLEEKQLTRQALQIAEALAPQSKMLLITNGKSQEVLNAFSNLPKTKVLPVNEICAYDLVVAGTVVMLVDSLPYTQNWIVSSKNSEEVSNETD